MVTHPLSIYLHIPFCTHRCGYCDFNTYAGLNALIPDYVTALLNEIEGLSKNAPETGIVHSVYFGGGTPSLLPVSAVDEILRRISEGFAVDESVEVTLEVNPGSVSLDYFAGIAEAGINRISMGVQSSRIEELRVLEREHGYEDAINAVRDCRAAGIDNLSIDLIFGVPGQRFEHWQHNLGNALRLKPDHISLYALSVEHGTPFASQVAKGIVAEPDSDLMAEMYEWTEEALAEAGFYHYEISNWARDKSRQSRHNLQYWRNLPYLGLGAGAHGYASGIRTANVLSPAAYIQRLLGGDSTGFRRFPRTPATVSASEIGIDEEVGETMMMGLRLIAEGVSRRFFEERFGETLDARFGMEIRQLVGSGLLLDNGQEIRLSRKGHFLGNQVFVQFI